MQLARRYAIHFHRNKAATVASIDDEGEAQIKEIPRMPEASIHVFNSNMSLLVRLLDSLHVGISVSDLNFQHMTEN